MESSFFKFLLLQVLTVSVEPQQVSLYIWKLSSLSGSPLPLPAALNISQSPSLYLLYCYTIHPKRPPEGSPHRWRLFPSPGGGGDKLSSPPSHCCHCHSNRFHSSQSLLRSFSSWLLSLISLFARMSAIQFCLFSSLSPLLNEWIVLELKKNGETQFNHF